MDYATKTRLGLKRRPKSENGYSENRVEDVCCNAAIDRG